jgi:hypothetical protein
MIRYTIVLEPGLPLIKPAHRHRFQGWTLTHSLPQSRTRDTGTKHFDKPYKSPQFASNNNYTTSNGQTFEMTARKMRSADNLHTGKWSKYGDQNHTLPSFAEDGNVSGQYVYSQDQSKWIHRDKLARIETEELEAAGIYFPKNRAGSRQRRDRNDSRLSYNTESDPALNRPRKDSSTLEALELSPPSWDLRTPEEIAQAQENAYFTTNGLTGSTRIPVAKTSPVPIPLDFLERGSSAARSQGDEDEYGKVRSRSASATFRDVGAAQRQGKRSVTDTSPKKGQRKNSISTPSRPGTRSGPKDSPSSGSSRPATRHGRTASRAKHPEGEPPWMANTFKPDPRLPPDQQYPPFVAKRMAQEQMEKEGKFGDAYDTDFRPLNDNLLGKPGDDDVPAGDDAWPLKPAITNRPLMRSGSLYSTMPKITDKQQTSPIPSPRPGATAQMPNPQMEEQTQTQTEIPQQPQHDEPEDKKAGCGCCVVM